MREPNRQIHLDFHTSEHCPDIGAKFDAQQWQSALQLGRVELINIFGKCHHSWCYYPTKVGRMHPNLAFDLMGEQLEACHQIGVKAPIYITMGWSATDAETHPDWCVRKKDGGIIGDWGAVDPEAPKPTFQWKQLCPSGEYHELVMAHAEEICRGYPIDGLWFDIYQLPHLCYCDNCRRGMADAGLDVDNLDDVRDWRARTVRTHCEAVLRMIHGYHADASVYFNGLTSLDRPENLKYRVYEVNTKQDLEDLPTTWGGYDKLPVRAKYFHKEGKPQVAMSGKFHTSWGEFGGFKHPDAIKYEAAMMTAYGVRCNFGDQLHPSGEMDLGTYANIGAAYQYVEAIEEYGLGGVPASNLGLWLTHHLPQDEGTARMLMECQLDYDAVRPEDDLAAYDTIIVPSLPCLSDADAAKLTAYAEAGGKLLLLGEGALNAAKERFVLPLGAEYIGPGNFDQDYLVAGDAVADDLVRSPFLCYEAGLRSKLTDGAALAAIREPYFSRTFGKYCGHQNAPYRLEDAAHPGVVRHGNVVWCAHGLDRLYYQHGARVHRQMFENALRLLHTAPMAEADLLSAGRISLLHQPDERRYVLHLLYGPPLQRGRCQVIEDLVPLRDVQVTVRLPEEVQRCSLIPDKIDLEWQEQDGALRVEVPRMQCHAAVVFGY